ncbi:MAG: DUF1993 domain-containing protein [Rhodospirillales bacterium]
MYQAAVPALLQTLNATSKILGKAEAEAARRKIDPAVLLGYRLAPDMFPLTRQVQLVTDFAKGALARLAGQEPPKYEDTGKTIPELKARIAKTIAYVESFKPAALDGSESRDVTVPVGGKPTVLKGRDYLVNAALPNFYFHATAAYAILRHCGVQIGKGDFLNRG